MKFVRTFSMIIALAGASTVYAQTPAKAPVEKKAPAPAPAKDEISAADAAKVEKFFNEFMDAFVKNQDSCLKMAAAVNAVLDKHLDWIKKMAESGKEPPAALKEKMQKRQGEMIGPVMKCKDDKDLMAALKRFEGVGSKKKDAATPEKAPPPPAKK